MYEDITHLIREVLVAHDGTCLDDAEERDRLAAVLATALLDLLAHPKAEGDRCSC